VNTEAAAAGAAFDPILAQTIASGIRRVDEYIGNTISDSPGAHIGFKQGLDERETRDLLESLLRSIERDEFARSLRNYFRALRNYCDSAYKVLGSRFPKEITLEEVYVPLQAREATGNSETFLLSDAIRSAFNADSRQLLIEGLPGSGKSTLLRQIARHAWDNPESVGLDRRYIPLPVRFRSYARSDGASREDRIWRAIDRAQDLEIDGSRPPSGFYEAWPRQLDAPWLFLLDGFDEIPEECRDEVLIWLRRLIKDNTTLLITTRPTSDLPDTFRKQVKEFVVQPLSPEQQKQLAEKWLGGQAVEFQTAFSRFAGGELGGTPLLLTIAAIVYNDSGQLPTRRSELYRKFVNNTWEEALKQLERDDGILQLFQD